VEPDGQSTEVRHADRQPVAPPEKGAHCCPEAQVLWEQVRTHMEGPPVPTFWQVEPSGQEHVP
jgi:hypothetical protein